MRSDEEVANEIINARDGRDHPAGFVRAGRLAEREVTKALLETIRGDLAGPATTISFLAAEDSEGDCVRWSDVERIFDARIAELEGEDGK